MSMWPYGVVFVHEDIRRDALEELNAFQRASSNRFYEYNRKARATTSSKVTVDTRYAK